MTTTYTSIIYPTNYRHKDLTLEEISEAVSKYFNIPDLGTKCSKRKVAYPRHMFCYISRMYTPESWKSIADHVKRTDHTTAMCSVNRLKDWLETDDQVRSDLSNIKAIINEKRNCTITERRKIA